MNVCVCVVLPCICAFRCLCELCVYTFVYMWALVCLHVGCFSCVCYVTSVSVWHRSLGAVADLILVSVPTMWVHMCGMSKCMTCTRVSCMPGVSGSCHGSPSSWALQNDSIGGQPLAFCPPSEDFGSCVLSCPLLRIPLPQPTAEPQWGWDSRREL